LEQCRTVSGGSVLTEHIRRRSNAQSLVRAKGLEPDEQ
jgi:hypothetical protein